MRKSMISLAVTAMGVLVVGTLPAQGQTRSLRSGKRGALTLRLAKSSPTRGFEAMALRGGETVYVAARGGLSAADIQSASIVDGSGDVRLSLTSQSADRLAGLMQKQGIDRLAVFTGGKLLASASLELDAANGRAVLSGLSAGQAGRITRLVGSAGPMITLVASSSTIRPGGTASVDVFVKNVSDLRAYQVTVVAKGGTTGQLVRDRAEVDTRQMDYVFGALQKAGGVDQSGGRIAYALFEGGVDVTSDGYLGRYFFTASEDASGTFEVAVLTNPSDSILMDSHNRLIPFAVDRSVASITVGDPSLVKPVGR